MLVTAHGKSEDDTTDVVLGNTPDVEWDAVAEVREPDRIPGSDERFHNATRSLDRQEFCHAGHSIQLGKPVVVQSAILRAPSRYESRVGVVESVEVVALEQCSAREKAGGELTFSVSLEHGNPQRPCFEHHRVGPGVFPAERQYVSPTGAPLMVATVADAQL